MIDWGRKRDAHTRGKREEKEWEMGGGGVGALYNIVAAGLLLFYTKVSVNRTILNLKQHTLAQKLYKTQRPSAPTHVVGRRQ